MIEKICADDIYILWNTANCLNPNVNNPRKIRSTRKDVWIAEALKKDLKTIKVNRWIK